MNAVRQIAKALGIPEENVHSESFQASTAGEALTKSG